MSHLDACGWTNELAGTRGFDRAVKAFLGRERADYFSPGALAADQVLTKFYGPGDEAVRTRQGLWLFSACEPHFCPQQAAILLTPSGDVLAIGVLSWHCPGGTRRKPVCEDVQSFDVFVRRQPIDPAWLAELEAWAKRRATDPHQPAQVRYLKR